LFAAFTAAFTKPLTQLLPPRLIGFLRIDGRRPIQLSVLRRDVLTPRRRSITQRI
jgi:hypothetical protein